LPIPGKNAAFPTLPCTTKNVAAHHTPHVDNLSVRTQRCHAKSLIFIRTLTSNRFFATE